MPFIIDGHAIPAALALDYVLHLPNFDHKTAKFKWSLKLYRDRQVEPSASLSGDSDRPSEVDLSALDPDRTFITKEISQSTVFDQENNTYTIKGDALLTETSNITGIEFSAIYWPDEENENGYAKVTNKEDKLSII